MMSLSLAKLIDICDSCLPQGSSAATSGVASDTRLHKNFHRPLDSYHNHAAHLYPRRKTAVHGSVQ